MVSSPARKELGSCCSALMSKKLNKMENQQLFLRLTGEVRSQGKALAPKGERQTGLHMSHNSAEQQLLSSSLCGNQCRVGKGALKVVDCWGPRVDESESQRLGLTPHRTPRPAISVRFTSTCSNRFSRSLTVNIGEKSPFASDRGRSIWKYTRALSSQQGLLSGEIISLERLNYCGFIRS